MSFGTNYGILFTARGIGGLVLSRLQQMLTAQNGGSFTSSFALRLSGCDAVSYTHLTLPTNREV